MEERDAYLEHPEAKAHTIQGLTKVLKTSGEIEEDSISETSRRLLAWAKAAAVPDHDRRAFPLDLLASCCRYMEALATARPARFSAECQSLATPVAALVMHAEPLRNGTVDASPSADDASNAGAAASPDEEAPYNGSGSEDGVERRKASELWVEMLGICLLPFCRSSGSGNRPQSKQDTANGKRMGEFDGSDSDEDYSDSDEDEGESSRGQARSGWVAGWMRRAGVAGFEPPECPFDVQPGGKDEGLPVRLAALIASRVKTAAGCSRPSSVSPLATVLAVLCAFTATQGHRCESHGGVVKEAFSCLVSLAGTEPENSAQAECVKEALVSLKECSEAARLPTMEEYVPAALSTLEGVPKRLKLLLTRSRSQGPKAYSTARSFCRDALAAAVACARKIIGRAGTSVVAADPRWFSEEFVIAMASPLLLGDGVRALRAASEASPGSLGSREEEAKRALKDVVMPGAIERLTKALANVDRYSAAAAKEVLKAAAWLVEAAQVEMLQYRDQLGMALVKCATSGGRSTSGIGRDEKLRLCLRAIHRLCSIACNCGGTAPAYTATAAIGSGESSTASARAFAEAACDLVGGVVEREWIGARGTGREGERSKAGLREEGDGESIITVVKAHTTLVALVRSDLRVQGLDSNGEWPPLAKRMAKLAWAFAYRVRKAGAAGPSSLGDDDVMLLCQGADVLEALADCASVFFEGYSPLLFFAGDLSQVLTAIRTAQGKTTMHPVVVEACAWVNSMKG